LDKGSKEPLNLGRVVYQKLRTPSLNGETLQIPLLSKVGELWQENLGRIACGSSTRFDRPLNELQTLGRSELISSALKYSGEYLDGVPLVSSRNIIMSGHQPELFHPGVWYKNFVLSELAMRQNALAVNLVVDSDLCSQPSVSFPNNAGSEPGSKETRLESVAMDAIGEEVPYEARPVIDWKLFESFGARLSQRLSREEPRSLAERLWNHVNVATARMKGQPTPCLGHLIAAGRHSSQLSLLLTNFG
jgi:hypothetical protein